MNTLPSIFCWFAASVAWCGLLAWLLVRSGDNNFEDDVWDFDPENKS